MPFKAHKLVVVIFMLVALTTQVYMSASANLHSFVRVSYFKEQPMTEHRIALNDTKHVYASGLDCMGTDDNLNMGIANSCCNGGADCSPAHCSSCIACSVLLFFTASKVVTRSDFTRYSLILSRRVGSFYRPPISC